MYVYSNVSYLECAQFSHGRNSISSHTPYTPIIYKYRTYFAFFEGIGDGGGGGDDGHSLIFFFVDLYETTIHYE